jgi:CPA2 family monovalent cation:H+ antiporter-2
VIAAALGIVLIAKPLVALAIVLLFQHPLGVACRIAIALAQIGEFSFIVAAVGGDLGLVTGDVRNTIIATAIASIALNPLLYRAIAPFERRTPRGRTREAVAGVTTEEASVRSDASPRAVVIGYGPVGKTVSRLLLENDVTPTIVDLNLDTIRSLHEQGVSAVYGDAAHRDTLISAGVPRAQAIILSVAGLATAPETIRLSHELNPSILILARTASIRELVSVKRAGATLVYSGESEVALAFTEAILGRLGATAEQIDRERARVREDLLAAAG